MRVLPIVERELRVAARQRATYRARVGLALAAILVGTVIFVLTLDLPPAKIGRNGFAWLAGILLLYCVTYGRRSTADCLSQEKREGTFGLLFLTDLKGYDVILGKLVATSVRGFYGLLAVFPVLAIPLLLGGISSGEFWRVVLVLMDTFLFSLAIGMLGSALSRDRGQAMAANLSLLLLLMAVPPACMFALEYFAPSLRQMRELLFSCPAYAFYLCDDMRYLLAPEHFWWSVAVIHALSWLLILIAGWIVPRSWQDQPARAGGSRARELWHAWRYGPAAGQAAFRKRTLDANSFCWLAARMRFKPVHVWTFLACVAAWWAAGRITSGRVWLDASVTVLTALMLNGTLKVWLAIEAGQQLAEDRRTGAFELLLSVPLTDRDILRGQLLALRRQFLWPVLAVLGVGLWLVAAMRRGGAEWQTQATWLAGMFLCVADLVALTWVGMWRALVARSHNLATISTVTLVLLLPWALFGAVVGGGHVWSWLAQGREWAPDWRFYLALWVGLGLAADLGFGLMAWWQLRSRFRELALGRFAQSSRRDQEGAGAAARAEATAEKARSAAQPSRDGRKEAAESATSSRFAGMWLRMRPGGGRVWLFLSCGLALVAISLALIFLRPDPPLPPAVVVSLSSSNGPVRVFDATGGLLLILPDGTLWRWGKVGLAAFSRATVPERVGTDSNWLQAAAGSYGFVALRRDGSLWEWGHLSRNGSALAGAVAEPRPVDSNRTWVGIAATATHAVALRRDGTLWAWGDNEAGELGNGPGPDAASPVQVGTNGDWAAVCCPWTSTLALRRDGTLWTWGPIYVSGSSTIRLVNMPKPTQVCRESDWAGFVSCGFLPLVRNRAGELWEPFHAAPDAEASAASSFRLVVSNAVPGRFTAAWRGGPKAYELRPDGTLWERAQPLSIYSGIAAGQWRRLGKRSDWTALWGAGGAALGLTADGTLWTWGLDPGQPPAPDFLSRLRRAQSRLVTLFGSGPKPGPTRLSPVYQKQPRPLMRLVFTNAVPPAP